jgi:hypothetical protein
VSYEDNGILTRRNPGKQLLSERSLLVVRDVHSKI